MSEKKINIAIIGATGYTGLDLIRILSTHPKANIIYLCATKNLGKKISFFDKRIKKKLPKISSTRKIDWSSINVAFFSLPNGESQKLIKKVYNKNTNVKFIDLAADFRITNLKEYKNNYKIKHLAPKLLYKSIYSISEFTKSKIKKFRIIANPGCYPTSIQLPLIPLIKKKLIKTKNIIIDAKSGYSGAGKNFEKKFTHKNLYKSTYAYNTKFHRHVAEIDQEIKKYCKKKVKFTFNPHILPTFRGILTSIYLDISKNSSIKKIIKELKRHYRKNKFIKIMKINSELGSGNVLNTNMCEISVCETRYKNKIVIFCALDNLVKGASGQAVQNMNLIFNLPETMGLR